MESGIQLKRPARPVARRCRARSSRACESKRVTAGVFRHRTNAASTSRVRLRGRASKKRQIEQALSLRGISPHSLRKVYGVKKYQSEGMEAARRALQHSDARVTEIYALSDWLTGTNAELPLYRKDLPIIIEKIVDTIKLFIDK